MKRTACWLLWFVLVPGAIAAPAAAIEATPPDGPPARARALWERWPQTRFVDVAAPCLRPADLSERIEALVARHPEIERQRVGRSIEGRPIQLLKVGHGATHILLWSQMHGDEPSATPALLDLADELLSRPDEPANAAILDRLTLILVPMLNPDGAEAYRRRNAQGIDINRDALNLATPEGRLLKELRRAWRPALGFNLHDQNRRRTVGNSDTLATISVLAVVGDEAKTVTPERRLSLRAAGAIAAVLSDFIPGGVGRFDDTWSERSFGDNLTAWGTPVVLIESGGVLPGESLEKLTRLNFVALLEVLHAVAIGSLTGREEALYQAIPENNSDLWSDVVLRGGRIVQPGVAEPYRVDLAFDRPQRDRERAGCAPPARPRSEISELGDARVFAAGREIDADGVLLVPSFEVGVDGWRARRWLDGAALGRLAESGVARVVWRVGARDFGVALALARQLDGPGRPRIEPVTTAEELPPVVLRRAAAAPADGTLAAAVATLEAASRAGAPGPFPQRLARLSRTPLRFEGPASFLVVRGATSDEPPDLSASAVSSVFLDGVDLREGSR